MNLGADILHKINDYITPYRSKKMADVCRQWREWMSSRVCTLPLPFDGTQHGTLFETYCDAPIYKHGKTAIVHATDLWRLSFNMNKDKLYRCTTCNWSSRATGTPDECPDCGSDIEQIQHKIIAAIAAGEINNIIILFASRLCITLRLPDHVKVQFVAHSPKRVGYARMVIAALQVKTNTDHILYDLYALFGVPFVLNPMSVEQLHALPRIFQRIEYDTVYHTLFREAYRHHLNFGSIKFDSFHHAYVSCIANALCSSCDYSACNEQRIHVPHGGSIIPGTLFDVVANIKYYVSKYHEKLNICKNKHEYKQRHNFEYVTELPLD